MLLKISYCIALGALSALAQMFPGELSCIAWIICWSSLLSISQNSGVTFSFTAGYSFGIGQFIVGLHWFFAVLQNDPSVETLPSFGLASLVIVYLAIWPGLTMWGVWLVARLTTKATASIVGFPVIALLAELLRATVFTGFPFLQPAYLFVDTSLSGFLPIGGAYLVNIIAYVFVGFAVWCYEKPQMRSVLIASSSSVFLLIGGYFLSGVTWVSYDKDDVLTASLVTGDFEQGKSGSRVDIIDRVNRYTEWTLEQSGVDLALWPESTIGVQQQSVLPYLEPAFTKLDDAKIRVLTGSYLGLGAEGKASNVLFDSFARSAVYSKQHLVPFGEYTPRWSYWIRQYSEDRELSNIQSLPSLDQPIEHGNWSFMPNICFELLYEFEWLPKTHDVDFILHITDLSWIEVAWVRKYFERVARVRAVESGKPTVYVGNFYRSSYFGVGIEEEPIGNETTNVIRIRLLKTVSTTPYVKILNLLSG